MFFPFCLIVRVLCPVMPNQFITAFPPETVYIPFPSGIPQKTPEYGSQFPHPGVFGFFIFLFLILFCQFLHLHRADLQRKSEQVDEAVCVVMVV